MITPIEQIVAAIRNKITISKLPIIIAIDGCSGSGKTTIANQIKNEFNAVVIPLDDFFSPNISEKQWEEFTVKERYENVFTWKILRDNVLKPLKARRKAKWISFDFNARRDDGTYDLQRNTKIEKPADIVILEGAYSSSPILEDLLDMTILLDVPVEECHSRTAAREEKKFVQKWHKIWDEVEAYYFSEIRPTNSFTLVVKS